MATSGTITFNQTVTQIITDALQLLGYLAAGETATTADYNFCLNIINKMVKAWEAQGIHLWTASEGTLYLVQGQATYNLEAGASGANASDGTGTPVETTLVNAVGSGVTSIVVATSTGMTMGDNIGIQQDNQVITWGTISSITGTTVVTNTATTSTAAAGNQVFTYTTQCPRVLNITGARLRDSNNFDRTIKIEPRKTYDMIPQKTLQGPPIILYYSPQLNFGQVNVWPAVDLVSSRIKFTYIRCLQDLVNSTDNVDLPTEWLECITYNLAVRIAPAYGISITTSGYSGNPDLKVQAAQYLEELKAWDSEEPYVQWVPNYRYR